MYADGTSGDYEPRGARRGDAVYYDSKNVRFLKDDVPLVLDSGAQLPGLEVAYETYGHLNEAKDNAVLICHAFTGSAHPARHGAEGGYGWWDGMFGANQAFDLDKLFVICTNVLGSCYGTTGPRSINPETGKPWGATFPVVTIGDMVESQKRVVDALGIDKLRAVVGGSMGGMLALMWIIRYPDRVAASIPIACADSLSPDGIAFHFIGRESIVNDKGWNGGCYDQENPPQEGLAVARQLAHISYLNHEAMERKFQRKVIGADGLQFKLDAEFEVEGYLKHQGSIFIERFDPNSYLYLSRAMDYFDLAHLGPLEELLAGYPGKIMSVSYLTDGLFPIEDARRMVRAMKRAGVNLTSVELPSPNGHDSFLTETDELSPLVRDFLEHITV